MDANLLAAINGARIGATVGSPFRGSKTFKKIHFFEPIPMRQAATECFDTWPVFAHYLATGGAPEGLSAWLNKHWLYNTNETGFAKRNWIAGFTAPASGSIDNPLSNGSQAIGRAAFWGALFHGDLDSAARWAYFDAAADHAGVGVIAAVAVARLVAAARPGVSVAELARVAMAVAELSPRTAEAVRIAIRAASKGGDAAALHQQLWESIALGDIQDAALSLGFIVGSLLIANGEFEDAVCSCAGLGGASDQTTLAVACIAAKLQGDAPQDWLAPIGDELVFGHGLREIDLPRTAADLAAIIPQVIKPEVEEVVAPEPLVVSSDLQNEPEALSPDVVLETVQLTPVLPPIDARLSTSLASQFSTPDLTSTFRATDVTISCEYVGTCCVASGDSLKFILRFLNNGATEVNCDPSIKAPKNWNLAHKLASFRLPPGAVNEFPVVAQPPVPLRPSALDRLTLTCGESFEIPIRTFQNWYWVGPFANPEGTGFDTHYRPEDVWSTSEVFNGRSNLPVKWQEIQIEGMQIEVEKFFSSGAGVAFLYCRMVLPKGKLRIVCAASVGCIVWVNRDQVIKYHDTHHPVPRAILPYVAEFESSGETHVLIKILRNTVALEPFTIYFLDDQGEVVSLMDTLSM